MLSGISDLSSFSLNRLLCSYVIKLRTSISISHVSRPLANNLKGYVDIIFAFLFGDHKFNLDLVTFFEVRLNQFLFSI